MWSQTQCSLFLCGTDDDADGHVEEVPAHRESPGAHGKIKNRPWAMVGVVYKLVGQPGFESGVHSSPD